MEECGKYVIFLFFDDLLQYKRNFLTTGSDFSL